MANKNLPGNKAQQPSKQPGKAGRPKRLTYRCVSCGLETTKQDGVFMTSSSELFEANNGYVPFCKKCLEHYYLEKLLPALEFDEARSIEMMCAICDWYYSESAFKMSKKAQATQGAGILSSVYGGRRGLAQVQRYGTTYIDTITQRREEQARINNPDDAAGNSNDPDANHIVVDPEVIKMFGLGYLPEEYEFLDEQYNDWINRYDCQTKAQEELFKNLAVAQLNIRAAQKARDGKAAAEAMKIFQNLLDTAQVTPKQDKGDQLAETNTFGTLIKRWEDERPIPEPDPAWADVDGIRKYINTWFLGHLCKMFRVDNDASREYEEELAKYTVDAPVIEEAEDEDATDKYSDIWNSATRAASSPSE